MRIVYILTFCVTLAAQPGARVGNPGATIYGSQLVLTSIANPASPTLTCQGGVNDGTSWTYGVAAEVAGGGTTIATTASVVCTARLSSVNSVRIVTPPVTNAMHCVVYRTVAGTSPSTTGKIATVGCGTAVTDEGLAGDSATAPTVNTTGSVAIGGKYYGDGSALTGVSSSTAPTQLPCPSTSSSTTAYICATNPVTSSYTAGLTITWQPNLTSGATPTLNAGAGALAIRDAAGVTPPSGFFTSGAWYNLIYDSANNRWQSDSCVGNGAGTTCTSALQASSLAIGSSTQQYQLSGRGADSGVNQGVPYFKSTTADTPTAFDIFPNGSPTSLGSGPAWLDACANDLSPLNTVDWICNTMAVSGKVFSTANGSMVSAVLNGTTATVTTSTPHHLSAGATSFYCISSVNNTPFPTSPGSNYGTIDSVTSTTFTWTTSRTAGTYTTGQVCYFPGNAFLGAHVSSSVPSGITNFYLGVGTALYVSPAPNSGNVFFSAADGVFNMLSGNVNKFRWASNIAKYASDQSVGFNSGTDSASGSADVGIDRDAAGVVGIVNGAATTTAANYRDLKVRHTLGAGTAPTLSVGTGTIAGTDEAGRVTLTAGSQTSITVTFGTAYTTNIPICVANDETTALVVKATPTLTTLVMAASFDASDKITWVCRGY